jgi:ribosomal protein S18 acetylase RimI-like enzyme
MDHGDAASPTLTDTSQTRADGGPAVLQAATPVVGPPRVQAGATRSSLVPATGSRTLIPEDSTELLEEISVTPLEGASVENVRMLLEVDLQTFAEPTFTHYTASVFLQHGRVFALRLGADVIGTCVFMRSWEHPNEVNLLSMGILPGFRGQGFGQRCLEGVLDRLRRAGLLAVRLMVAEDNRRARKVYRDSGFTETGHRFRDPRTDEAYLELRIQLQAPVVAALPSR